MHAAAGYEPGAIKKEPRANRDVTTTSSGDPSAGEHSSAGGRAGFSQPIR